MTTRFFLCVVVSLCMLATITRGVSGEERSLFRTTSAVVDIVDLELLKVHTSASLCPWILVAYSDGCGHCRSAAPTIIREAKATFDTPTDAVHEVTVAALNCQVNTQACHDLGAHGVPSFYLLTPDSLLAKEPTLSPIQLHSPDLTKTIDNPAPQKLNSFAIGRGGGVGLHFDLARTIWSGMKDAEWLANNKERCQDMRSVLHNAKQANLTSLSPAETQVGRGAFTEDTAFHSVDVANAFFYTLYHEVALVGLGTPERRYALFRFLRAVQQRLPGLGADVLLHEMADHKTPDGGRANPADFATFTVEKWQKLVLDAGIPYQGTPRNLAWRTCKGSSWRYRGFPCGQWLLYHALTANSEADTTAGAGAADDTEILVIIKDYARNFFSCEACRHHFMRFEPNREEDPVWQLWKVHNLVNYHLANVTDGADPLVPKRQFPGKAMCPLCYRELDAVTTNPESAVVASALLRFLRARYRWVPSSLRAAASATTDPAAAAADGAVNTTAGARDKVILVHKTPMGVNVFLTMAVVVVVVLAAMQFVLRRRRSTRAKRPHPILPLRMQP